MGTNTSQVSISIHCSIFGNNSKGNESTLTFSGDGPGRPLNPYMTCNIRIGTIAGSISAPSTLNVSKVE
jgi:hypothetical protein